MLTNQWNNLAAMIVAVLLASTNSIVVANELNSSEGVKNVGHQAHGNGPAKFADAPSPISDWESGTIQTGLPFAEPPIISSIKGNLDITLNSKAAPVNISGKRVNARAYSVSVGNKSYPRAFMPPTIVLEPGDNFKINLENMLGEPTNMHLHGFFISPIGNQDNIFVELTHGKDFLYNYFLSNDMTPGLYWYHPHYHPQVEEQVFGGMSGLIYVRGLEKYLPPDLQGIKQRFLGLKDFQVDAANTIPARNINSDAPTNRTINGLVRPKITMRPGETQFWHIGNIGADIWYNLEIPGLRFTVIAEDGNPVDHTFTTNTLLMPGGKRFDVLVQAAAAGDYQLITLPIDMGPSGDNYPQVVMASLKIEGSVIPPISLPTTITSMDNLASAVIAKQRFFDLTEDQTTNQFFINQRIFNANQVDATPLTNTVEEWTFFNATQEYHPIHIHVNDAQIMSVNDIPQNSQSLVDTISIPYAVPNSNGDMIPGKVVVRTRFREFIGPYVFHCHILNHEDNGMMTIINVTSPDSK
jgi:suppressor of ftsI